MSLGTEFFEAVLKSRHDFEPLSKFLQSPGIFHRVIENDKKQI